MVDLRKRPFCLEDADIAWVEETIRQMTLDEKIGQLFVPIGYSGDPGYLENVLLSHHIGGIMYRCGDAAEMQETHRYLQGHSKIPLLIGANLEAGGDGIAKNGTAFGKQMLVAASGNPEMAYRLGKVSTSEGHAVGCNWAFAPVCDIDCNWRNPITNVRTYGSSPDDVLAFSKEYIRAAKEEKVLCAIKHFPGDGCDEVDQHILTSVNNLSCDDWERTYGKVYRGLIEAGAETVMVGHIASPAWQEYFAPNRPKKLLPATLSPELLQGLLRGRLGFNGLITSDSTCMVGFSAAMSREQAVPTAIEAGCDMFLFNKDLDEDFCFMKKGYENGLLSEERLHDALMRILGTKAMLGLHRMPAEKIVPGPEALSILRSPEHLKWAEECADQGITLVKDTQGLLPLNPNKTPKVLLEVLGHFGSNARIQKSFHEKLEAEGFEVEDYLEENFETAKFDVGTFKKKYDIVIYLANVENASNQVTNRLDWYTFWGNGNNVPWFTEERPVLFISLQNPYHLVDVPMIHTMINCYANHEEVVRQLVEKIMGRSHFKGKSPVDPFLGKDYLRW